jgi:hypothetical protein
VNDDLIEAIVAGFEHPLEWVTAADSLSARFGKIRRNYEEYQRGVDAGQWDWMRGDPYAIADWVPMFTPIEDDAWCEIRSAGLPMWPQFPVGKFFVDFGNPVAKVALECDGKEFHSAVKDAERDKVLRSMGWRVIRVTGSRCYKTRVMLPAWQLEERGEYVDEGYDEIYHRETLAGVMRQLKRIFDGRAA